MSLSVERDLHSSVHQRLRHPLRHRISASFCLSLDYRIIDFTELCHLYRHCIFASYHLSLNCGIVEFTEPLNIYQFNISGQLWCINCHLNDQVLFSLYFIVNKITRVCSVFLSALFSLVLNYHW